MNENRPSDDDLRRMLVEALERHDPVEQWFSESFGEDNHFPTIAALTVGALGDDRGPTEVRASLTIAFEHVFGAALDPQPPFFVADLHDRLDRVVAESTPVTSPGHAADAAGGDLDRAAIVALIDLWYEVRAHRALAAVLPVWLDFEDGLATTLAVRRRLGAAVAARELDASDAERTLAARLGIG